MATRGSSDFYLSSDGGWVVPRHGSIGKELRRYLDWLIYQYGDRELLPLYLEDGIYNFYLQCAKPVTAMEKEATPSASDQPLGGTPGGTRTRP